MAEQEINLTGIWSCDDGGRYWIRQNGDTIWWYGEKISDESWPNVARGEISGNTIIVSWSTIPPYEKNPFLEDEEDRKNYGILMLNIETPYPYKLKAEKKTMEFPGSLWEMLTLVTIGSGFSGSVKKPKKQKKQNKVPGSGLAKSVTDSKKPNK